MSQDARSLPDAETAVFARPWVFIRGVPSMKFLPPEGPPEIAFAGRSNVGKSSLINALLGRKGLARTSNTPGRTQELNYFVPDGHSGAGDDLPLETRLQCRLDSSLAVTRSVEAVDALFTESGGRAIFLTSPLHRAFLDVHCARAHYANNPEKPARNLGGVLLGGKNVDFFV